MSDAAEDRTDAGEAVQTESAVTAVDAAETEERSAEGMSTGMRTLSVLLGMAVIILLMYGVAMTFRP